MIKKASTVNVEKIISFLEFYLEQIEEYDGLYYTFEQLLETKNFTQYYVLLDEKENEILDLIYYDRTYDIVVLYPYLLGDEINIENTFSSMHKYFKNKRVVMYTRYIDVSKYGMIDINLKSSIDEEFTYLLNSGTYSVFSNKDVNLFRNAIEKVYFPKITINKKDIVFKLIDGEEANKFLLKKGCYEYPMWTTNSNNHTIIGFRYLQPDFWENHKLLVAMYNDVLVGCIKYGRYQEDKPYKHYGLNYIEVKKSYREYGISKMLIDEMAKILDNDMPLSLSQETTMGKMCKMAEKFKNAKFKTHVYAYRELEETLYK